MLHTIEKATNQKITLMRLPSTESINDRRITQFKQKITDTRAVEELGFFYQLVEQYQQEHNVPALEIAAALARMVQGNTPLLLPIRKDPPLDTPREIYDDGQPTERDGKKKDENPENRNREWIISVWMLGGGRWQKYRRRSPTKPMDRVISELRFSRISAWSKCPKVYPWIS